MRIIKIFIGQTQSEPQQTCKDDINWTVLTRASFEPAVKLCFTVSTKCTMSIWMSTNTYSILIPSVALIGTLKIRNVEDITGQNQS